MFSIRRDRSNPATKTQLESLMEAAGDAVFRLSAEGEILYASKRAVDLIDPGANLVGRRFADVVVPADHPAISVAISQAIEAGQPSRVNLRLKTPTTALWIELQMTTYPTEGG
ncbi:MAG TPA: PAS domain-containing protein, partial [Noviherbaspirillum sp.]